MNSPAARPGDLKAALTFASVLELASDIDKSCLGLPILHRNEILDQVRPVTWRTSGGPNVIGSMLRDWLSARIIHIFRIPPVHIPP